MITLVIVLYLLGLVFFAYIVELINPNEGAYGPAPPFPARLVMVILWPITLVLLFASTTVEAVWGLLEHYNRL